MTSLGIYFRTYSSHVKTFCTLIRRYEGEACASSQAVPGGGGLVIPDCLLDSAVGQPSSRDRNEPRNIGCLAHRCLHSCCRVTQRAGCRGPGGRSRSLMCDVVWLERKVAERDQSVLSQPRSDEEGERLFATLLPLRNWLLYWRKQWQRQAGVSSVLTAGPVHWLRRTDHQGRA
jgi:hypothetical protein